MTEPRLDLDRARREAKQLLAAALQENPTLGLGCDRTDHPASRMPSTASLGGTDSPAGPHSSVPTITPGRHYDARRWWDMTTPCTPCSRRARHRT
jgi:hypothetical protein